MKIIQKHEECIGCGNCVVLCPKFWEMPARNASRSEAGGGDDGKAYLKGGKKNPQTGEYELEIKKAECNKDAADGCPVQVIFLRD